MVEPALKFESDSAAFLDWEERQAERYELVGGVVRMMVGGTIGHNDITDNIQSGLRSRLRGSPCRARSVQTRVRAPGGEIMYPDVLVSCTPRRPDETVIDDPVLVVEVLSPSTAHHDQAEKRWAYQTIESLRQLVFVAPNEAKAELVTRQEDGTWLVSFITGSEGEVALTCLGLTLPMAEIYADIDLARVASSA